MRAVLVGCAFIAGCGGSSGGTPPTGDGGGTDGSNPNTTTIMFTLNNSPNDVEAFAFFAAYQDGDGAWKPAARSGDTYAFGVSSATWGFAYTCQVNVNVNGVATALRNVIEYHFAVAERTSLTDDIFTRCTDRIARVQLSGNISNRPTMGTYRIAYNDGVVFIDRTNGNYAMLVAPGTHDLLVFHGTDLNTDGDFLVDGAIVQRNVAIAADTTKNVAGNTTTQTRKLSISVSGFNPTSSETTTSLTTANGTAVLLAHVTKTPLQSTALATAQVAAGDVYDQRVTVGLGATQSVTLVTATTTPANVAITTAPTPLGATTTTSAAMMPYPMFKSTWPGYAGAVGYTWTLAQTPPAAACVDAPGCNITWTAWISPGAAGAMPSYTMPDLSQLPGWSKALQLVAGTMVTGGITAMTSTAGAVDFPPQPPAAGTKRVFAHATFTVTP